MTVQQISVFLENKAGRLAAATAALKSAGIDIRTLTIAESENYGLLRMIVNNPDAALAALKEAGFAANQSPVIAVEINDRTGLMHDIVLLCDQKNVNVEYMYSFVEKSSNKAILFLRFEDADTAARMFVENGYKLLSPDEVCRI